MNQGSPASSSSGRMFQSASNVVISGGSFIASQTITQDTADRLGHIYQAASPNAILNAGGRADDVRCYPGTRKEVLRKTEAWMNAGPQADKSNSGIFWLSGPAGAGKSAIVQTLAERCISRGVPMANFFFFRGDTTRNSVRPLVATLLTQLFDVHASLKPFINNVLVQKPMILNQSIQDQFQHLIDASIRYLKDASAFDSPIVIMIDGLDECASKHDQQSLIKTLHYLVSRSNSPFLVLIASRPEAHLTMTFNEVGTSAQSIFLNEEYRPADDIRVFVVAELAKIKKTHHLGPTLSASWPSKSHVDQIVDKSSGQFIYAATVIRFIADTSASPALSLDRVQGLRPLKKSSPFAELDAIYTFILSQVEDWESARDVLTAQVFFNSWSLLGWESPRRGIYPMLHPLGYGEDEIQSCISDLTAIVKFEIVDRYERYTVQWMKMKNPRKADKMQLVFYHASFTDYLCDKTRSGEYHVDVNEFSNRSAAKSVRYIQDYDSLITFCFIMKHVLHATPSITKALKCCPDEDFDWDADKPLAGIALVFLARSLHSYCRQDAQLYEHLVRNWAAWFQDKGADLSQHGDEGPLILTSIKSQLPPGVWEEITGRPSAARRQTERSLPATPSDIMAEPPVMYQLPTPTSSARKEPSEKRPFWRWILCST